jgi:hypothetical protein
MGPCARGWLLSFGLGAFGDTQDYQALRQTLWHFGQAFVKLHVRFRYTVNP